MMDIDLNTVQEFIDRVVTRYNEETILGDRNFMQDSKPCSTRSKRCAESIDIYQENINRGMDELLARTIVEKIITCEASKFLNSLYSRSDHTNKIGDEFVRSLMKESRGLHSLSHFFLPDKLEYKSRLRNYGQENHINVGSNIPVTWFDPCIFTEKGFAISHNVSFYKNRQNQTPIVRIPDHGSLSKDNSENKILVDLIKSEGGKVRITAWTEFIQLIYPSAEDQIHTLELPSLDVISSNG